MSIALIVVGFSIVYFACSLPADNWADPDAAWLVGGVGIALIVFAVVIS